jgi:hypothetical protein
MLALVGRADTFYAGEPSHLQSEPRPITVLKNRRLPIMAFSLNVYWRVNRSPNNPVRVYDTEFEYYFLTF